MSNAFEITVDDVLNVCHSMGKKISGDKAREIFNTLNHDLVECEALKAGCFLSDNQTNAAAYNEIERHAAYDEIERQIKKEELL
jgi:hypothetical protein